MVESERTKKRNNTQCDLKFFKALWYRCIISSASRHSIKPFMVNREELARAKRGEKIFIEENYVLCQFFFSLDCCWGLFSIVLIAWSINASWLLIYNIEKNGICCFERWSCVCEPTIHPYGHDQDRKRWKQTARRNFRFFSASRSQRFLWNLVSQKAEDISWLHFMPYQYNTPFNKHFEPRIEKTPLFNFPTEVNDNPDSSVNGIKYSKSNCSRNCHHRIEKKTH